MHRRSNSGKCSWCQKRRMCVYVCMHTGAYSYIIAQYVVCIYTGIYTNTLIIHTHTHICRDEQFNTFSNLTDANFELQQLKTEYQVYSHFANMYACMHVCMYASSRLNIRYKIILLTRMHACIVCMYVCMSAPERKSDVLPFSRYVCI